MPGFTYIHYDGTDERILELVSQMISGNTERKTQPLPNNGEGSSTWDEVAKRFAEHVSRAEADGNSSQKNAILAWLKADGEILLTKLWKASGVKVQHDYSGVGGAMTKNMVKAKGPKAWYTGSVNSAGDWVYRIVPELVDPLKRSFGLK
jgi:hypothetical protein